MREISDPVEALEFAHSSYPNSPGRRYYSNLAFFLGNAFHRPGGASRAELGLCIGLIRRFDEAGELPPGAAEQVTARLR